MHHVWRTGIALLRLPLDALRSAATARRWLDAHVVPLRRHAWDSTARGAGQRYLLQEYVRRTHMAHSHSVHPPLGALVC